MAPSRIESDIPYTDNTTTALPTKAVPAAVSTLSLPATPTSSVGSRTFGSSSIMNTSMVESKFLSHPEELGVVAVGFSGGQCKPGVDAAPSALIESGLLTQLRDELGYSLHGHDTVHLYTDLVPESDPDYRNMKNPKAVSAVTRRIADQVYNQAKEGRLVLTLGGDHSIAIGTIGGSAKAIRERLGREIAVIWVDAHADINTPETSGSGNIHGMPVSFLTGLAKEEDENYFGWLKDENRISVKKLVYIGLRDVDPGEKRILRENGIKAFSMFDIDRYGIGRVMEMALAHIGTDTPIHLSFDVDALDPMWAPSTGTPVRGGLTLREGDYICECVHETGSLVAVDLVEVNPSLAPPNDIGAHETVRAGCSLVRCALGESLL
ncbi:putative arginase [Podospora australis]|uniref:Arginase n=1 Tax=Podospora australis TaxID=1536484 RepID=A0AAN6WUG3_9PEZI|nr:putative arginase [Podospora australis]